MTKTQTLSASQIQTLEYVREHGSIMLDACGSGGYNVKSAEALVRKGFLVEVHGEVQTVTNEETGRIETYTNRFAALPETD